MTQEHHFLIPATPDCFLATCPLSTTVTICYKTPNRNPGLIHMSPTHHAYKVSKTQSLSTKANLISKLIYNCDHTE